MNPQKTVYLILSFNIQVPYMVGKQVLVIINNETDRALLFVPVKVYLGVHTSASCESYNTTLDLIPYF